MSYDVTKVTCLGGYILEVEFENGEKGQINLSTLAERGGIFSSFSNPDYFRQVAIDRELGVLTWPGGVDIAPEAVYHLATGKPMSL